MSIFTKNGRRLIADSVTIDSNCYDEGELIRVSASVEYELHPRYHYISDLRGERPHEVRDVVNAALKDKKK